MDGAGIERCPPLPLISMSKKNICIDCGIFFEYNSTLPKGATPDLCPNCSRRNSRSKLRLRLLKLAASSVECRRCGYQRSSRSLHLVPTKSFIANTNSEKEQLERARYNVILCSNCKGEYDEGDLKMSVLDSSAIPPQVSFYMESVVVNRVEEEVKHLTPSEDVIELEVLPAEPEERGEAKRKKNPSRKPRGVVDVPEL